MTLQNHTLLEKDVEKPGTHECISFQVPVFVPRKKPVEQPEELASVHILIRVGDTIFIERKKVLVQDAYVRHIIEPDKPYYKPGETVRFRIVRLDEEFKAIDETVSITPGITRSEGFPFKVCAETFIPEGY
uniref:pregnancy zone protein-like n=1 Tax=Podarcis muralis TaxID=64176 RepID=UPI00109EEFC3|nr:pregnancy zone protein-like [Podarcis muralis]